MTRSALGIASLVTVASGLVPLAVSFDTIGPNMETLNQGIEPQVLAASGLILAAVVLALLVHRGTLSFMSSICWCALAAVANWWATGTRMIHARVEGANFWALGLPLYIVVTAFASLLTLAAIAGRDA